MAVDKHRVALVTGGMGGLGEAICIKLAALGNTVVTTHSPGNTKAAEWLDAMKKQGFTFHAHACDVADWESAVACVKKVAADVGPVDVLVNNAGITRDMTFKKMDKANWDAVIRTNLDSCFNMTKQVRRHGRPRMGPDHQHLVGERPERRVRADQLSRPPRPGCTASPRRWRSKSRARASP